MKKETKAIMLSLKILFATALSFLLNIAAHSQCNTNAWQARYQSTQPACFSPWVNAGQFVNPATNTGTGVGVMQMPVTNTPCATNTNFYPEFQINGNLCITNNFSYQVRFRNQNPLTYPNTFSAYDVYIKLRSAGNQESGVALFDANANYNWASAFTNLYAGPMGAPTQQAGSGLACLRPNMNTWTTVTLQYQNNVLTCLINGVACTALNYTGVICNITSLNIMFKSAGELDWVRILDANGVQVWQEDFNSTNLPVCFTPLPACTVANLNPTFTPPTCTNNVLSLFANPNQQLTSYTWTGPNGFTSTQQNPVINNPSAAYNGTYTVTGLLNSCTPAVAQSMVVNFTVPSITSNIPDVSICNGDSVQLTASGGGTYSWTPNINISNTTIANPLVWPNVTTNYIVTITNGSCVKVDTVTVTVNNCTKCTDSCYWNVLGNAHITPANFLGSINNADLKFRTSNRERMIITATGNVGINLAATQVPNARLHINNVGSPNTRLENLPSSRQTFSLYVDGQGFVYRARRTIFGRETDDADKDIENKIAGLESHINNVSNSTSSLEFRSTTDLSVINNMQSMLTTLTNQVNDMQSQIQDLQWRLDNCGCYAYKTPPGKGDSKGDAKTSNKPAPEKASTVSVNPNPFAKTTSVHYSIPASTQQAELRLLNISGVVIKTYAINNKQPDGNISISEPFVSKGSYLVVLIADGKIADSKIIVTTGN